MSAGALESRWMISARIMGAVPPSVDLYDEDIPY